MPSTTVAQFDFVTAQLEANMDQVGDIFAPVLDTLNGTKKPPDVKNDTPVNGATPVAMDIIPDPPVALPFRDAYLREIGIGKQDYTYIEVAYSFWLAHKDLNEGWYIVASALDTTHVYRIKRFKNKTDSWPVVAELDCERTGTRT